MTPKIIKTAVLSKDKAKNYLNKAEQFYYVMQICAVDKEWDAATLNGVHAAISITDALLVWRAGIHSISPKHDDAAVLLRQHFSKEELHNNDSRLTKILTFKNLISYQPEQITEAKGIVFAKDVERYFEWGKGLLKKLGCS